MVLLCFGFVSNKNRYKEGSFDIFLYILQQQSLPRDIVDKIISLHYQFIQTVKHSNRMKNFCALYDNRPFIFSVLPKWITEFGEQQIPVSYGIHSLLLLKFIIGLNINIQSGHVLVDKALEFSRSYLKHCSPGSIAAILAFFEKIKSWEGSGAFFFSIMPLMLPKRQGIIFLRYLMASVSIIVIRNYGSYTLVRDAFSTDSQRIFS